MLPPSARWLLAPIVCTVALAAACSGVTSEEPLGTAALALSPSDPNLTPKQVNGGTTGPIYRRTIDTAVAFEGNVTLPDYIPIADEQPWIYFGFGTATGSSNDSTNPGDMEVGFAFQSGVAKGVKVKVSRWLPYIRKNTLNGPATFYYGNDDIAKPDYARVDTGSTIAVRVECKPVGGVPEIHIAYQRPGDAGLIEYALTAGMTSIQGLKMPGIKAAPALGACDKIFVRRVVGIAPSSAKYDGILDFHRLGPVTFEGTQITFGLTKSSVTTSWDTVDGPATFIDPTHWWWIPQSGVLHGSVNFPSDGRVKVEENGASNDDVVTLFPGQPTGSWADWDADAGSGAASASSSSSGGTSSGSGVGAGGSGAGSGSVGATSSGSTGNPGGGSTSGGASGGGGGGCALVAAEHDGGAKSLALGLIALLALRLRARRRS